jgi:hypothetical protein
MLPPRSAAGSGAWIETYCKPLDRQVLLVAWLCHPCIRRKYRFEQHVTPLFAGVPRHLDGDLSLSDRQRYSDRASGNDKIFGHGRSKKGMSCSGCHVRLCNTWVADHMNRCATTYSSSASSLWYSPRRTRLCICKYTGLWFFSTVKYKNCSVIGASFPITFHGMARPRSLLP